MTSPFDPKYDQLPDSLAIFPLRGALLLPGGQLPLRIFEPRYLAMIEDALKTHRLIGMVQPRSAHEDMGSAETYEVGCAGRISAFSETDEGHVMITLSGLIRFSIKDELASTRGYRVVTPNYGPFRDDMRAQDDAVFALDQEQPKLLSVVKTYFDTQGFQADWDALKKTPLDQLITSLSMICPFEPAEKQALLEAKTLQERLNTLTQVMQFAAHDVAGGDDDEDEPPKTTIN